MGWLSVPILILAIFLIGWFVWWFEDRDDD